MFLFVIMSLVSFRLSTLYFTSIYFESLIYLIVCICFNVTPLFFSSLLIFPLSSHQKCLSPTIFLQFVRSQRIIFSQSVHWKKHRYVRDRIKCFSIHRLKNHSKSEETIFFLSYGFTRTKL